MSGSFILRNMQISNNYYMNKMKPYTCMYRIEKLLTSKKKKESVESFFREF